MYKMLMRLLCQFLNNNVLIMMYQLPIYITNVLICFKQNHIYHLYIIYSYVPNDGFR